MGIGIQITIKKGSKEDQGVDDDLDHEILAVFKIRMRFISIIKNQFEVSISGFFILFAIHY